MPVQYVNSLKDARMQAVVTALDAQSSPATLQILDSSSNVLVDINLQKPSFSEGSQQIVLLGVPLSGVAGGTGTASAAQFCDGGGTVQIQGLTVGISAADIILNSTTITSGQTITITSATIIHG